jgi:glycosyltransferase involved in cell wall biosynthesis
MVGIIWIGLVVLVRWSRPLSAGISDFHAWRLVRVTRVLTWVTFAGSGNQPMGMQRYELEVLEALRQQQTRDASDEPWRFETLSVAPLRHAGHADVKVPMRLVAAGSSRTTRLWGRAIYRRAEFVHRLDLRLPPAAVPEVVTIHDLPPVRFSDEGQLAPWALASATRARLVICPSAFAADEVREITGVTRVAIVPNGVSPLFGRDVVGATPDSREVDGPYVLHVGGATERKNLNGLAGAWELARRELPGMKLVLAGPPDSRRDAAFGSHADVLRLGYRGPSAVAALMRHANMVVVPSVYEGFGLPALEAMAAGTPVVAARRGALPEVCGSAGWLVEPDADSLAEGIVRVVSDTGLREELRQAGAVRAAQFSWERSAEGHLRAYAEAFGDRR